MLARFQRGFGQREMGVVWGGDRHQVDIGIAKERLRRGHHLHRRPVGQHFLFIAARHRRQRHPRRTADERRMKGFARIAVTD